MMREFATTALFAAVFAATPANAANQVGDANNSGAVDMTDAALVMNYLNGIAPASQLSPLALANGDGFLDLRDLLFVAQFAAGAIPEPDGPPIKVSFTSGLPLQDTYGLGTPFTAIFPVQSAYPIVASFIEGIQVDFSILEPGVQSYLQPPPILSPPAVIASGAATVSFVPVNNDAADYTATVQAAVNTVSFSDTGTQAFTVRPNCQPACVGDEFQICSDYLTGGKCLGVPLATDWHTWYSTNGAVGDYHYCNWDEWCSFSEWRFDVESSAGTPFAVWVRLRYTSSFVPLDEYYFQIRDSDTNVLYLAQIFEFDFLDAAKAPNCAGQDGDFCWVLLTDPVAGLALPNGENRLAIGADGDFFTGDSNGWKGFDGYIYTTDLSYVPDEMDTACDSDALFSAGTCDTPPLNWGLNTACPECGNCTHEEGETCDDGILLGQGEGPCSSDCFDWCIDTCGDGNLQAECGEECDAGLLPQLLAPLAKKQKKKEKGPKPFTILDHPKFPDKELKNLVEKRKLGLKRSKRAKNEWKVLITLRPNAAIQDAESWVAQHEAMKENAEIFLSDYKESELWDPNPLGAFPVVIAQVSEAGLLRLADDPMVLAVETDKIMKAQLNESRALMNVDAVRTYPIPRTGASVGIAVIDSGIRVDHEAVRGRVVHEECFCDIGGPCCPGGNVRESGFGSAKDDVGHGTAVSASALSSSGSQEGMAPGSHLVSLKAVNSSGQGTNTSFAKSIDWIIRSVILPDGTSTVNPYNIRVINMSFGLDNIFYSGNCDLDRPILRMATEAAKNAGLAVFASSGNEQKENEMIAPACLSDVISVGSVYDAGLGVNYTPPGSYGCTDAQTGPDVVPCFSNRSFELDLLAPGCLTTAADFLSTTANWNLCGTSPSTAMASGVAALMFGADPDLTPDRLLDIIKGTAVLVRDERWFPNGCSGGGCTFACTPGAGGDCPQYLRIDAAAAVAAVDRSFNGTCTENCVVSCASGYVSNGAACDPVCGDGIRVDGEDCDPGGVCVGGSVPGKLCVVGGPLICLGGGTCQPLTGFGCLVDCTCDNATNQCGDGNVCDGEQCDFGYHCVGGSNAGAECTYSPAICTGGGSCELNDHDYLCDNAANPKPENILLGSSCAANPGYCTAPTTCTQQVTTKCDVNCNAAPH